MKKILCVLCVFLLITSCGDDDLETLPISPPENASLKVTNSVEVTTDANNFLGVDDVLTYTILIKNTGNVTLNTINLTYNLADNNGTSLSLDSTISFVSAYANSSNGSLAVEETATYTANYTITQNDVDAGGVSNSITANASSPEGTAVSDVSDNGDDTDGNSSNDTTETTLTMPEDDPTIMTELHLMNRSGEVIARYVFDDFGTLTKIYRYLGFDYNNNEIYNFEYDAELKLINFNSTDLNGVFIDSKDILYDSDNRVTQIGTLPYYYFPGEDYYRNNLTDEVNEYTDSDGNEVTRTSFIKYIFTNDNPIAQWGFFIHISVFNPNTNDTSESSSLSLMNSYGFENSNLTMVCSDIDCVMYSLDSNQNPLLSTTNLNYIFGFLILWDDFDSWHEPLLNFFSNNNKIREDFSDPSDNRYVYVFNSNNLPESVNRQSWYGYLEEEYLYFNYFYQGGTIPDYTIAE